MPPRDVFPDNPSRLCLCWVAHGARKPLTHGVGPRRADWINASKELDRGAGLVRGVHGRVALLVRRNFSPHFSSIEMQKDSAVTEGRENTSGVSTEHLAAGRNRHALGEVVPNEDSPRVDEVTHERRTDVEQRSKLLLCPSSVHIN